MTADATHYFWMLALLLFVGIAVFWFLTAWRFGGVMKKTVYTRGVSIVGEGKSAQLSCPAGRKIRVFRARYVCGAKNLTGIEQCDPFNPDGSYSSQSTTSAVEDLEGACNGRETCVFTLGADLLPPGCDAVCGPDNVALNASYDCVPS